MQVRWVLEDASRPGGVESVVRTLNEGLCERGVDSTVLSWLPPVERPGRGSVLSWFRVRAAEARRRSRAARSAAAELARDLASDPDLVVLLDPGSLSVARHLRGLPRWGVHMHWSPDLILRPWRYTGGDGVPPLLVLLVRARLAWVGFGNRRVLGGAPFLVTLTPSHTRQLGRIQGAITEVSNPVAFGTPSPRPEPGPVVTLGYVGRLAWEKGPDVLMDALSGGDGVLAGTELLVAGSGPLDEDIRARAQPVASTPTTFLGWVADPWDVLERVDVIVLPSRSEGVPLVLVEALAAGCLVVAAEAGSGVRDVLADGRLGRIVPVGDHLAQREAMSAAVSDVRAHRRNDPDLVRETVERHSLENVLDRWVALLADLTARRDVPRN